VLTVYPAVSWAPRVRAHELPRDARIVLARYYYRNSSVCLSVRPSVRHIGWTSSKLITRIISLGSYSSLLGATTTAIKSKGNTPKIRVK